MLSHALLVYWLIKRYRHTIGDNLIVIVVGVILVNVLDWDYYGVFRYACNGATSTLTFGNNIIWNTGIIVFHSKYEKAVN